MKRMMTIEELGVLHVAVVAPADVEPCLIQAARAYVTAGDMEGLEFGATFAETMNLNASRVEVIVV
jgi:hypothetical protein